jgi:hypothetical protein
MTVPRDRSRQVFDTGNIRAVVGKARPVDVSDSGEVRHDVRSDLVNRALNSFAIEQVADMVLDTRHPSRWNASIESEHRMTAPHEQVREMKPNEPGVSGDEDSQRGLPSACYSDPPI